MSAVPEFQKPIGYWLKRLDAAITEASNQALGSQGLTRFQWQALNSVKEAGPITKAQLLENLQDFMDEAALDDFLAEFLRRGWLMVHSGGPGGEDQFELTSSGMEAHRLISTLQGEVRKRLMIGIHQEEYAALIRLLQKMVQNLEG